MTRTVLAADVGGTKTLMARYEVRGGTVRLVREETVLSNDFSSLEQVVRAFLDGDGEPVQAGVFGIAGPVIEGRAVPTNFSWEAIEQESIARAMDLDPQRVRLMNDLETTACGVPYLGREDLETVNAGVERKGNIAVIAAGTGLGQGILFRRGDQVLPVATEGGHASFSPRDDRDVALFRFLRHRFGHVSQERVVSGPGLENVFDYLRTVEKRPVVPAVLHRLETEDARAVIGGAGVAGTCATCREAVDWFVRLYGAQAGNLALTVMALGGVFVGGGIVTKILPRMTTGAFMDSFVDKGRYMDLLEEVPVNIILNPKTALLGAAHAAREMV